MTQPTTKPSTRVLGLKLAKVLHDKGHCDFDCGTWAEVQESGYECQCFETIDLLLPHIDRETGAAELLEAARSVARTLRNLPPRYHHLSERLEQAIAKCESGTDSE